jgi:hypothetical protein
MNTDPPKSNDRADESGTHCHAPVASPVCPPNGACIIVCVISRTPARFSGPEARHARGG